MGAASYNRGTRAIAREVDALIASTRATNEARAQLWRRLLNDGAILAFEGAGGAIITAGPHITADGKRSHSFYRDHGDRAWRCSHIDSAWGIALRIIEHVGRRAPYKVVTRG